MCDSFMCVTCLIHVCDMTHSCATWLLHMCDMVHSYVWHGSFVRVTWLIRTCDMAHSHVWHGSFTYVTWLMHMCNMHTMYASAFVNVEMRCLYLYVRVYVYVRVCISICLYLYVNERVAWKIQSTSRVFKGAYGVATISRLLKIIDVFCKRAL